MSKRHISLVIAGLIVAVFALSCIVFFTQTAGDNSRQAKIVDTDPNLNLQPVENPRTLEDLVVKDVPIVPERNTPEFSPAFSDPGQDRIALSMVEPSEPVSMKVVIPPCREKVEPQMPAIVDEDVSLVDEVIPMVELASLPDKENLPDSLIKKGSSGTKTGDGDKPKTGNGDLLSPTEYWLSLGKKKPPVKTTSPVEDSKPRDADPVILIEPEFAASHTIEGYGGGMITPVAYLTEASPDDPFLSNPSVSFSFLKAGSKDIETLSVSETLFGRIELSYAMSRLGVGSLDKDIRRCAALGPDNPDIVRDDIYLHTFSIRGLLIKEDSFDLPLPAVTAGVHFKYNNTIQKIDSRLGGRLNRLGLERSNGVDYTLTASKTFADPVLQRPLTVSTGLRFSQAAQIGYFGFGDACRMTFEGNVFYRPVDWMTLGYEIRQKKNPFNELGSVFGEEDWWHAFSARLNIGDNLSLTAMYGHFGNFINSDADCTLGLQLRWEF